MCRKRNIDDKVVEAADGQVEAVVNLGAGFDTMAMSGPIKGCPEGQELGLWHGSRGRG